jgi:hypothetical protein
MEAPGEVPAKDAEQEDASAPTVTLPLPEIYKYKLLYLGQQYEKAKQDVVAPLKKLYEDALITQANAAVEADTTCVKIQADRNAVIHELVAMLEANGPAGYRIQTVNPDTGVIEMALI